MEPDLKDGSFYFPYPTDEKALTSNQIDFKDRKQGFLISKKIICIDENRKTYDLTKWMKDNEYSLFPTIHPDFLDALSRIYDMDPIPPRLRTGRVLEPEREALY